MFKSDVYISVLKDASTVKALLVRGVSPNCIFITVSMSNLMNPITQDHHRDSGELNADNDTDRGMEEKVGASLK